MSPAGDVVAAQLVITLHASGALTITGPIADPQWCLDALDHARDFIKNSMKPKDQIVVVPAKDVELATPLRDVELVAPNGGKLTRKAV